MNLIRVISGGQTGADISGVLAAKTCGVPTGGMLPKGWVTLDGPKPQYEKMFGMRQHPTSPSYPPRTEENVKNSDGTVRFFFDPTTAGEKLTKRLIDKYDRPFLDIDLREPNRVLQVEEIATFIEGCSIHTLNVAGNSHRTNPTVGWEAYLLMCAALVELDHTVDPVMSETILRKFTEGIYQH